MNAIAPTESHSLPGVTVLAEVHFEDLDPTGILHNTRYLPLLEHAVTTYWRSRGWHYDPRRSAFGDSLQVVRAQTITYLRPISDVGPVLVHFWIDRVGRTSYTYGFRFLSEDRTTVYCEGTRTHINLDPGTLAPKQLGDLVRAAAQPLLTTAALDPALSTPNRSASA